MKSIISIVTPSYNQGKFIERTIQSIISQKGNFYIDYIIQDGGSKDESVEIIKKYEQIIKKGGKFTKIHRLKFYKYGKCLGISYRWQSHKDKGQVDAILKGFSKSIGSIINWLNSDDTFYNENTLNRINELFINDPTLELISADGNLIDENDKLIGQMIIPKIDLNELIYLDYHVLQPSTFITKKLYNQNKKYLDIKMSCAFDANFYIHIFNNKVKSIKLKEILSCYRFYPEIKTNRLSYKRYKEQMKITLSISRNPLLILLSFIYRYFEIILRFKITNQHFQGFFINFKKFCYLIITGKTERSYE